MRVIPVIDLKRGQVVRAVGGKREAYRPVTSVLAESASPTAIASALVQRLGACEVYLADLDAIDGAEPAWAVYRDVADTGLHLWIDAGIGSVDRARQVIRFAARTAPAHNVIVGLESVPNPAMLSQIIRAVDPRRLVLSLDLLEGRPLNGSAGWQGWSAPRIAQFAVAAGYRRLIILDLARVGRAEGTGTESLRAKLHRLHPGVELLVGGGVRDVDEIRRLARQGCHGVLIGSALHNGQLTAEQLRGIE